MLTSRGPAARPHRRRARPSTWLLFADGRVEVAPRHFLPVPITREFFVNGILAATALSFVVIFVAELGDKSQLMALTFATRFKPVPVLIGITAATALVHLVSVGIGYGLGATLPTGWISLIAGLAFLVFGAWTLRGDQLTDDEKNKAE